VIEREHVRIVAHRLAVLRHAEEVTRNVSRTCRSDRLLPLEAAVRAAG